MTLPERNASTLRGTVTLRISHVAGAGHKTISVPDPADMPRCLSFSPGQKHLLKFVREGLIPCHSLTASEPASSRTPSNSTEATEELSGADGIVSPSRGVQSSEYKLSPEYSPRAVTKFLNKVSRVLDLGPVSQPRPYLFHQRVPKTRRSPSKLRKRRLEQAVRHGNPFQTGVWSCCSRYQCFQIIGPNNCFQEFRNINSMNPVQAKRHLISLYDHSEDAFRIRGQIVCARFLSKAFGFSNDMQCSIKNTPKSRGSATAISKPREVIRKTKRVFISTFIRHLAKLFGDSMPNREHVTLPVLNRKALWKECRNAWKESNVTDQEGDISRNYFYRMWRLYANFVKVRRNHGFTVCSRCEMLRSEMAKHLRDEEALLVLIDQHAAHLKFIEKERTAYEGREALAERNPAKYCSIIIDGADQKNYGLPHFARSTKSDSGHKLKVKVVGVLEHVLRGKEQLALFTMTEEYESGANHIIEVSHRILQRKKNVLGRLPPILFVQVDNCMRENKNRYLMAYYQSLVNLGVFKVIQVSFLPIGHTHADIDQAFSSISSHLKLNDAVTLSDLKAELEKRYSERIAAGDLDSIINYSELCEQSQCLNEVDSFSEYRYFRFVQKDCGAVQGLHGAECDVKIQDSDEWIPFPTSRAEGFLKFVPSFGLTPVTRTKNLINLSEVKKCLSAAEERVKDDEKMEELHQLCDKVFETREEVFQWKVEDCFELQGDYKDNHNDSGDVEILPEVTTGVAETLRPNFGYDPDDFVAVVAHGDNNTNFWIGRVKNVCEVDESNPAKKIRVRWYIASGSDPWEAKYTPAWTTKNGEKTIYEDEINVDTVLVRLGNLTTSKKLRARDKKAIKQVLNEN